MRSSVLVLVLFFLAANPSIALAHGSGEQPAPMAGAFSWGFLVFAVLVIIAVGVILFTGQQSQEASEKVFADLTGFGGYIAKMRLFSRNARLFMIHVVGMDVIYGTWAVLFNLYLLAVGFDIAFIGLRILVSSISSAVVAVPAGIISDRIGRKLSLILGDGIGATMSLVAISTENPTIILTAAVIGGMFSALHGVAEPAFMAENSEKYERVHLFSVSGGTRTAAMIIGSALAGLIPLIFGGTDDASLVTLYRTVAYFGIGGWFASLIPAFMLRRTASTRTRRSVTKFRFFDGVKHPGRIWRLTLPEVLIGLGAGFALPMMNVFFQNTAGSEEVEIGAVFAAGQTFLVVGSFLAPFLVTRWGKIRSVVFTRLASIPFILVIAFSSDISSVMGSVLSIAGFAYIGRTTLMNMANPVRSAFAMEILDPEERGTQVGIELALFYTFSGIASFLGAQMMESGDFRTPFLLMAVCYLLGSGLFWQFFVNRDEELTLQTYG
ncbi:MAG: MFS transporter [Chloroflexi bacterium]|nr:MFS transporter [Chloroflexota bacterium]